ncbi:bifunctional isocitrate dehydrogenase kinase/phosphatase [Chitinasiproducens palmae]|uniref:Isocitrate dehydrogenase kinase/phosphatase n=1 Tax=Chitinasiproducens palmae TaxID=1770053 RepID=A0A1H2PNY0_9BURK|nr:bifunctional isocitrate dehydrogenase kinase/phosphatase [Chitinasiproducens palmae]SDV48388.1 isocitrate dehydrogenase kinase/phosphatase [Chitinasiproducens palmae]
MPFPSATHRFPRVLADAAGFELAIAIRQGFDRHYAIFRQAAVDARALFEQGDWQALQRLNRDRIAFYDARVQECVATLAREHHATAVDDALWQQVKLHYIGLLTGHPQPECAETFFNSVCCRILHRAYFNNDFIFVRPALATEYLENDEPAEAPTYRVYYPRDEGLDTTLWRILSHFHFEAPFEDMSRDVALMRAVIEARLGLVADNFQIHVLSSPFFRNTACFAVARIINADTVLPAVLAIRRRPASDVAPASLYVDALLLEPRALATLFSFAHSYFLVDMGVPSAYVAFLQSLLPGKPKAEWYASLGLQKHGKALFYRDLLHHLRHSSDAFVSAPGIKGLVMIVFTLPSFPYVFKVIRDRFGWPKETTREAVMARYRLVKTHDRLGRMADTLEFSKAAFPRARFDEALLAELKDGAPSMIEFDGDDVVIQHLYIERRMTPLNLYLRDGDDAAVDHGIAEYGHAIKEMLAAGIFPGDMLYKNFGMTRHGRVVFYDYDEVEYLADCTVKTVPAPPDEEAELGAEPWYPVAPGDIFPETYPPFLLGDARVAAAFKRHHPDFFDPAMWRAHQNAVRQGRVADVMPYPAHLRLAATGAGAPAAGNAGLAPDAERDRRSV